MGRELIEAQEARIFSYHIYWNVCLSVTAPDSGHKNHWWKTESARDSVFEKLKDNDARLRQANDIRMSYWTRGSNDLSCTAKSSAARTMVYVVRQVVLESQKGQEGDSKKAEYAKLALL